MLADSGEDVSACLGEGDDELLLLDAGENASRRLAGAAVLGVWDAAVFSSAVLLAAAVFAGLGVFTSVPACFVPAGVGVSTSALAADVARVHALTTLVRASLPYSLGGTSCVSSPTWIFADTRFTWPTTPMVPTGKLFQG